MWATQRIGYLSAEKRKGGSSREIDDEIRQLGEKYAIPTEFTSYLVVEPGMRRDIQLRGSVSSVVTGVATAVAPRPEARAKEFEAARDASKQRAAANLAAADALEIDQLKKENTRRIGPRVFALRGETWTDLRKADSTRLVKVKPFSEAYFKIIDAIPELREVFALGNNVVVAGREVAIEIGTDGVDTISDSELKRLQSGW